MLAEVGRRIGRGFLARCVSRMGARGQGPGAGISISPGRHPAGTTASGATPDGEALAWVVVVGLGFRAIEDSNGSS